MTDALAEALEQAIYELIEGHFHNVEFGEFSPENAAKRCARSIVASLAPGNHLATLAPPPAGERNADLLFIRDDEDPAEYRALVERKRAETDADLARERNADLAWRVREEGAWVNMVEHPFSRLHARRLDAIADEMEEK